MQTSWEEPPERGRPRRSGADEAILKASRELMFEHGYAGFSMDEVASRAGVGRQSVYRRWPSKAALVVASMTWTFDSPDVFKDTGSFEGDLRAGLAIMRDLYGQSSTDIFGDVYFAMASDSAARELFNRNYVAPRRESLARAIERAIARGELREETDAVIVSDMVSGPFLYRILIGDYELNDSLVNAIVEGVIKVFGTGQTTDVVTPPSGT
ncbi:TetR/AcrR family transcriptional regulator [Acrocarpospora catenulata]|uniref:TetR/AcrR family transcriptional regulator n=1 Tax=Acrocarpospora catenulata TaxID=2836182 RepID=UPI002023A724|nr:TetR/AcrR family transcriptional regulator [Acrocarpospora catenulata]